MSYGTKKKFLFVAAMMTKPQYLLFDEPTNGLDEHSANELHRLLTEHLDAQEGVCVIVSHDLSWINTWRESYHYCPLAL